MLSGRPGSCGSLHPRGDICEQLRVMLGKQLAASSTPPLWSAGISAAWQESPKRLGCGRKRLLKVSLLRFPSGPACCLLPKNQLEVTAGDSPCFWVQTLSDKDRDGLSKYWLSFYTVRFAFSFLFFPTSANVGGTPEKRLGVTHCAAC